MLGDTNSAKRLKIPILRVETGNRCFDKNLPEETNAGIMDHISDVDRTKKINIFCYHHIEKKTFR